jgi:hypothetical protein
VRESRAPLLGYVNFDDEASSTEEADIQTWGAEYQAYPGFDPSLGF